MMIPRLFTESMLDDLLNDFVRPIGSSIRTEGIMHTDVKEYETGYEIAVELPGIKREAINAELKDGYLTISAETAADKEEAGVKYLSRERFAGNCRRSFYVGRDVTEEDIKAKLEDGVLHLMIPKKEALPKVEEKKLIQIEG